jgi:hypothetical protein
MADASTLATIASVISGFGVAMLFFRIQRELSMHEQLEVNWIPWADRLLIGATLISLFLVVVPLVALRATSLFKGRLPSAACAAASIMVGGYVLAILAHYRLFLGRHRRGPRSNPEPAEAAVVCVTLAVALFFFVAILLEHLI